MDKKKDLLIKNYLSNIFEKYFFYKNINLFFKKFNSEVFILLSNEKIEITYRYIKNNYSKYYTKNIFIFSKLKFNKKQKFYKFLILLFYPLFSIVRAKTFFYKDDTKIQNCIRQYMSSFGVNNFPALSEDWIIDNNSFNKSNTAFILEDKLSSKKMNILNKKKYICINANIHYPIQNLSLKILCNILFKYIPLFFLSSFIFLFINVVNRELLFSFLCNSLIWDNFSKNYKNLKYITQNNFGMSHFIRNYYLNKSKTKVFLYKHSFSENIFFKNYQLYSHVIFSYNCHDYEFQMSKIGMQMSISNKTAAKKIYISGPVWGSSLFDPKKKLNNRKKNHILALTSTFSPQGVNGFNEHLLFFKYLGDLLKLDKKLKITLKLKSKRYWYNDHDDCKKILKKLDKSKRFFILRKDIMARKLIEESDLIISMPFTTPCFEALYLMKKSFFVDIPGTYKNSLISSKTNNFYSNNYKDSIRLFNLYNKDAKNIKKTIIKNAKNIFGITTNHDPVNYIKKIIIDTK